MDIKLILVIICVVGTGSLNTIVQKVIQNNYDFFHSFFFSWLMFIGETISLFILVIPLIINRLNKQNHFIEQIKQQRNEDKNPIYKNWIVGIGSLFDCLASAFTTLSLVFLPASIGQIGRGGIILSVAIYSVIFLKKKFTILQYSGVAWVIVGILVVFYGQHLIDAGKKKKEDKKDDDNNLLFGFICLVLAWIIQGFQAVYQEKLLNKYEISLYRYVGIEGIYGLICSSIILFIAGFIPCDGYKFCQPSTEKQTNYIDNPSSGIIKMFSSSYLFLLCLSFICSITVFNLSGLYITSKVSSLFRMILDNARALVIWLFFLLSGSEDEPFVLSQLVKLLGFAIYVFGVLIYNQILFASKEKALSIRASKKSELLSSLKR